MVVGISGLAPLEPRAAAIVDMGVWGSFGANDSTWPGPHSWLDR